MGAELLKGDGPTRAWVGLASRITGVDLARICLRGPDRELARTEHLQPLMTAVCLGWHRKLLDCGIRPGVVLGHSLGEIAALAAAGVLSEEDAVQVATRRGQVMGAAAAKVSGGMLAVSGEDRQGIRQALEPFLTDRRVSLANDNAPSQWVLSGERTGLEEAARALAAAGLGRGKMLPVSGPWHSSHMRQAQEEFATWLAPVRFSPPRIPLILNATGKTESDPEKIRGLVVRNLTEPVQWRASMCELLSLGPEALFEIGPGRVLAGLARANGIGESVRVVNVSNQRGLTLAALWLATRQPLQVRPQT